MANREQFQVRRAKYEALQSADKAFKQAEEAEDGLHVGKFRETTEKYLGLA